MSYPLIITGAGASFDLFPTTDYPQDDHYNLTQWKPPLTNDLFDGTRFQNLLDKYSEMDEIVSIIRGKLRGSRETASFEKILTDIHGKFTKNDPNLYKGLVALLFYISDLFSGVTKNYYRQHNNYKILKALLKQYSSGALFVNFNYDLLLEKAMSNQNLNNVDDYVKNREYPIIKIHGAYNWFLQRTVSIHSDEILNCYELSLSVAEQLLSPRSSDGENSEIVIHEYEDPKNILTKPYLNPLQAHAFHPALALPVQEKKNYVCPDHHIELLRTELHKIDRIIIIGWKAADNFVHELLENELTKRKIPVAFVGKSNARQTVNSIGASIRDNAVLINEEGFSAFISSDLGEDFLK